MDLAERILRPGLLDGVGLAVTGDPAAPVPATCVALGATLHPLTGDLRDEAALTAAAVALPPVDALVVDAATPFLAVGAGMPGLRAGLDGAWNATRAVVNAHLIPAGRGLVVLLAPAPGAGAHAGPLRAALENTARSTSIEWARHGVRPVAVLPGDASTDDEVAGLVAWLCSPAGAYFSGCAFTLGAAAQSAPTSAQGTSTESSVGESRATT